jgi:hypothetical protein
MAERRVTSTPLAASSREPSAVARVKVAGRGTGIEATSNMTAKDSISTIGKCANREYTRRMKTRNAVEHDQVFDDGENDGLEMTHGLSRSD